MVYGKHPLLAWKSALHFILQASWKRHCCVSNVRWVRRVSQAAEDPQWGGGWLTLGQRPWPACRTDAASSAGARAALVPLRGLGLGSPPDVGRDGQRQAQGSGMGWAAGRPPRQGSGPGTAAPQPGEGSAAAAQDKARTRDPYPQALLEDPAGGPAGGWPEKGCWRTRPPPDGKDTTAPCLTPRNARKYVTGKLCGELWNS